MKIIYFFSLLFLLLFNSSCSKELTIFVSPSGNDNANGLQLDSPKRSIQSALDEILKYRTSSYENVKMILLPGEYYLENTIEIGPELGQISIEGAVYMQIHLNPAQYLNL